MGSLFRQALAAAARFGLKPPEARRVLGEVYSAISRWNATGRQLGLKATSLGAYATAFEHPLMNEARKLAWTG